MLRTKRLAICHPEEPNFGNGLCSKCYQSAYRAKYPERQRKATAKYRENNPGKSEASMRRSALRRFYGITLEEYNGILAKQNGVCAICKKPEQHGRYLSVDHDHACCSGRNGCGKCIRGLLCNFCNTALGGFKDNIKLLELAQWYIYNYRIDSEIKKTTSLSEVVGGKCIK